MEEENNITLHSAQVAQRILILNYLNCAASAPILRQQKMMLPIQEELRDKKALTQKNTLLRQYLSKTTSRLYCDVKNR